MITVKAAEDGLCTPQLIFLLREILKHVPAAPVPTPPSSPARAPTQRQPASSPSMSQGSPGSFQRRSSARRMGISSPSPRSSPSPAASEQLQPMEDLSLGSGVSAPRAARIARYVRNQLSSAVAQRVDSGPVSDRLLVDVQPERSEEAAARGRGDYRVNRSERSALRPGSGGA